jgi:hypothetical protein
MDIVIHVILVVMAVPGQHQVIVLLVLLDSNYIKKKSLIIFLSIYFFKNLTSK